MSVHGDATKFPVVPLSERAAQVPIDRRNAAPSTRANFSYQDEVAAFIILERLTAGGLDGVVVERATDLALIPSEGHPELISIKHREQVHLSATYWTVGDLVAEVLPDLHRYWAAMGRDCGVVFATNGGFNSDAFRLVQACEAPDPAQRVFPSNAVTSLRNRLHLSKPEAEAFFGALTLDGAYPSREHISASGIRAAADLLKAHRVGPITTAETVYRELCALIEDRSTDRPPEGVERGLAATIAQTRLNRRLIAEHRQYLPAAELLEFVLRVHDRSAIAAVSDRDAPPRQADTAFVGRVEVLERLDQLLQPGSGRPVPPLVIRGVPGCGKSALALHYAATRAQHFRTVRIDGDDRSQVIAALASLQPGSSQLPLTDLPGPVAPALPQNTALLIIIDGVLDPRTLSGLLPAESLCRVLVTANGRGTNPGWNTFDLDTWSRDESHQYLRLAMPQTCPEDADRLAGALHDHPLGISQAAAYCRSTGRTVTDFLQRFGAHPGDMLSREPAPGHPNFITTTTQLLLAEAERHSPAAAHLARALALLATVPVAETQLHVDMQDPPLAAPPSATRAKSKRRRAFWKRDRGPDSAAKPEGLGALTIPGAHAVITALNNADTMVDAIDALVRLSLIRRDPAGLVMHPLVALVLRDSTPEPAVSLAVAASWFLDLNETAAAGQAVYMRHNLPHLHALTSLAVRLDLQGPVVFAWCYWLSTHLLWLPDRPHTEHETSRYLDLRNLAARGYMLANAHFGTAVCDLSQYLNMAAVYGHVLRRRDQAAEAFGLFEDLLEGALRLDRTRFAVTALMNMGTIAEDYAGEQLRPRVDAALATVADLDHDMMRAAVDYVHAIRYRYLGKLQEAKAACQQALALAQAAGPEYRGVVEILIGEATEIARDLGEGFSTEALSAQWLDLALKEQGLVPDRMIIQRLCAAAAGALETANYGEAKRRLQEARDLASEGFENDAAVQAAIASVAGRYAVDSGKWAQAKEALSRAIVIQRQPDCPELGGLASDYYNLSIAQRMLSEFAAAQESAEHGLSIDLRRHEPRHKQVVDDYVNLAEINASARRDVDIGALAQTYAADCGVEEVIVLDRLHPNGQRWWAGVYLGRTDEGQTQDEAIRLACQIMDAGNREVIDIQPHRSEICLTVMDPLSVITVHQYEGHWIIAETLKNYMYVRDILVDYTEFDFGLGQEPQ
jgi:tetratricopeptide (TPR) repeat protein